MSAMSPEVQQPLISDESIYTLEHKERTRSQLSADIDAFLASGGNISKVADNVRNDPPKKPSFNYGALPI